MVKYNQPYGGVVDAPYINGDPSIGRAGSIPPAAAMENPQRELVNLINDVGLATATDSDLHQIAKAIQSQKLISKDDSGTANAYAVTLVPAPTAYFKYMTVVFQVTNSNTGASVINVNALGAKSIKHRADGSDIAAGELPANAIVCLIYDGTNFQLVWSTGVAGAPVFLTVARDFYVNTATGNDTFDGTAAVNSGGHGPFKTLQRGADEVAKYNLNGFSITVHVADGAYTAASGICPCLLTMPSGAGSVVFIGNTSTPSNVTITSVNRSAFQVTGAGACTITGFKFSSSGSNAADPCSGIFAVTVRLTMSEVNFGACSGYMLGITRSSTLVMTGNWTISGSSTGNAYANGGFINCFFSAGVETSPSVAALFLTASAAITLSTFVTSSQFGAVNLTWTSFTNPGNVTGKRYDASLLGVINSAGGGSSYYPGTIAGTTATGGQYA